MDLPPPSDSEAEKAVIASALITDAAASWLVNNVTPDMFYVERYGLIAEAIIDEMKARKTADIFTVGSRLRQTGKYAIAGGREALEEIYQSQAVASHVEYYGHIVMRLHYERETMKASMRMNDAIRMGDLDARDTAFEEMAKLISARNSVDQVKVLSAKESMLNIMCAIDEKVEPKVIKVGIRDVDSILGGLRQGHLMTVGARPRVGKTATLMTFGFNIAKAGYRVGIFTAEMTGNEFSMRALASESGIPHWRIARNRLDKEQIRQANEAAGSLSSLQLFYNETASPTLRDIRTFAESQKCDVLVVDYLTRCELPRAENMRVSVNHFMRGLKNIAKDGNRIVLLGAQVNRNADKDNERTPLLSDLKESSAIEEESDSVILLHSDRAQMEADNTPEIDLQIHVAKNRHGKMGRALIRFKRDIMRLGEKEQAEAFQKDYQKAAAGDFDGEGF